MPDSTTHKSQAEHNEKLVDQLADAGFPDWQATGLFYAAVHYVSMYFSSHGHKGFRTHAERDRAIGKYLPEIWGDYQNLKHWSEQARYQGTKPDESALANMSESLDIIKKISSTKAKTTFP